MTRFVTNKERSEVKRLFAVEACRAERVISVIRFLAFGAAGTYAVIRVSTHGMGISPIVPFVAAVGSICLFLMIWSLIAAKRTLRTGRSPHAMKYLFVTADLAVTAFLAYGGLLFLRNFSPDFTLVHIAIFFTAIFMSAAAAYLFLSLFRFDLPVLLYAAVLFIVLYILTPFVDPSFIPLLRDPALWREKLHPLIFFAAVFLADVVLAAALAARFRNLILSHQARQRLARYLPETIERGILVRGQDLPDAGIRCQATVLCARLEDFNTVTDGVKPEEIISLLNSLFTEMIEAVFAHEGALDTLGDGSLTAVFGVPLKSVEPEAAAVRAAVDMIRKVESMNVIRRRRRLPPLRLGIGVHAGEIVAGMVGGARRADFSVFGDAAETARRLVQYARTAAGRIIISEAARARLGNEFSIQLLGKATLKGRTEALKVYAVNPWLSPVSIDETEVS